MKNGRKAQSTIEFTVLMSFMILMFSVFFVLVGQKLVDLRSDRNYEIAKTIQSIVSNEFQLAKNVEIGYTRQFRLPGSVEGMNYQISIINNTELSISVGGKSVFMRIPQNVTGNISKGLNIITKNYENITINGFISNLSTLTCNCGIVDCSTGTPYYYGWVGNTCYYSIQNITCNYDGVCNIGQTCSLTSGNNQGITTGVTRTACVGTGCSGTTAPTLTNIPAGTDPYGDCGVGRVCDGSGGCVLAVNSCILDTSLIESCLLV